MTVRYTIAVPPEPAARELLVAHLWAAGAQGVWERGAEQVAWFDRQVDDELVPPGGRWEDEPDQDWQADWKAELEPVVAGEIVVTPTWLADQAPEAPHTIVLDPGQAFGTGHHPTTVMCLELLQQLALSGRRVLDVGTGTGVLAIGAVLYGAAYVRAVDIDPGAIEVAEGNAAVNGADAIEFAVGSVESADHSAFDVVIANLLTDTVTDLADTLLGAVAAGGKLLVSGITVERADGPRRALTAAGAHVITELERDGWVAMVAEAAP